MLDPDLDPYSINPDPLVLSSTDVIERLNFAAKHAIMVPGSSTGRPGHSPAVRGNTCEPIYLEKERKKAQTA